jgi:uncharacterized protein YjbI with pentapeptide repeats
MNLTISCRDSCTIVMPMHTTASSVYSEYLTTVLKTYKEHEVLTIDMFDSHVITSILGYIENGKIMFQRHITITPEYLLQIYKACDFFRVQEYPEIVDTPMISDIEEVRNVTIYGRIRSGQADYKKFRTCYFANVKMDAAATDLLLDACLLRNCSFVGCSFSGSSEFRNCLFVDCDFTDASIPSSYGCRFEANMMTSAGLHENAMLSATRFQSCSMRGFTANSPVAVHSHIVFKGCDLSAAVLRGFMQCTEIRCVLSYTVIDNRETKHTERFVQSTPCRSTIIYD